MDTESFLLRRRAILEKLDERRARPASSPYPMGGLFGMKFPFWLKWGLSLTSREGAMVRLLELGMTLAAPLLLKKKVPFLSRLLSRV
jgi:hypothetical protein